MQRKAEMFNNQMDNKVQINTILKQPLKKV